MQGRITSEDLVSLSLQASHLPFLAQACEGQGPISAETWHLGQEPLPHTRDRDPLPLS